MRTSAAIDIRLVSYNIPKKKKKPMIKPSVLTPCLCIYIGLVSRKKKKKFEVGKAVV